LTRKFEPLQHVWLSRLKVGTHDLPGFPEGLDGVLGVGLLTRSQVDGFLDLGVLVVVEGLSVGEFHGRHVAAGGGGFEELGGFVELLSAVVHEFVEEGQDSVESSCLFQLHGHCGEDCFGSGVRGHFDEGRV